MQTVLKLCEFQNLLFGRRIVVLRSLAISKIVFQALIALVLNYMIKSLETIQTSFLWNNTNPQIKHKTICKNFREEWLKDFSIRNKLTNHG